MKTDKRLMKGTYGTYRKRIGFGMLSIALVFASCSDSLNDYDATGTFDADEIVVSSEVAGAILKLDVSEGETLAQGQTIGLIDSVQLFLQKQQLEANILAVEAGRPNIESQLAPLEEQLKKQQQEKQRVENLLKAEAATTKQLDDINSAILVLQKQLAAQRIALGNAQTSADAQTTAMRSQIAQLNDRLAKCHITAPINGTVLAQYAHTGELTSAGRPLFKLADMEHVYLKAYVTSQQLADIRLGQAVQVRADFGNKEYRSYDGKITWISDKSEFTPKNITTSDDRANMVYAIKVAVRNDGYLKLGMYGEVKF